MKNLAILGLSSFLALASVTTSGCTKRTGESQPADADSRAASEPAMPHNTDQGGNLEGVDRNTGNTGPGTWQENDGAKGTGTHPAGTLPDNSPGAADSPASGNTPGGAAPGGSAQ